MRLAGLTTSPSQDKQLNSPDRATHLALCFLVMALAIAYLAPLSFREWIPHDDGMLAQAAQRVLEGQLPHRDFDEIYTGGLTLLHSLAFRAAGSNLATLRATLFITVVASLPAWYYVALKFAPPLSAALATLACFVWSVPMYPASMPSWYNLIFAICAVASAMRYLEDRRRRWIFLAGLISGLSTLIKISGLYLLAALTVYVTLLHGLRGVRPKHHSVLNRIAAVIPMGVAAFFAYAPFGLMRRSFDIRDAIELALAPSLMCVGVFMLLAKRLHDGWERSFATVLREYLWLAAGFLIPIVLFLIPYWRSGSLGNVWRGVFVSPQLRFNMPTARLPGPALATLAAGLPVLWLLLRAPKLVMHDRKFGATTLLACGLGCALALWSDVAAKALWLPFRMAILPLTLFIILKLVTSSNPEGRLSEDAKHLMLIGLAASWCALVQYPLSSPIYFCYVAPLVVLGLVAALSAANFQAAIPPLLVGCLLLGIRMRSDLNPSRFFGESSGARYLDIPRGRIWIQPDNYRDYSAALAVLRAHARSRYTLALPDLPELYFLSDLKNPTRVLYDAFDTSPRRDGQILRLIDSLQIRAVVVNRHPMISAAINASLADSLTERFPFSQSIGKLEVRWRS